MDNIIFFARRYFLTHFVFGVCYWVSLFRGSGVLKKMDLRRLKKNAKNNSGERAGKDKTRLFLKRRHSRAGKKVSATPPPSAYNIH